MLWSQSLYFYHTCPIFSGQFWHCDSCKYDLQFLPNGQMEYLLGLQVLPIMPFLCNLIQLLMMNGFGKDLWFCLMQWKVCTQYISAIGTTGSSRKFCLLTCGKISAVGYSVFFTNILFFRHHWLGHSTVNTWKIQDWIWFWFFTKQHTQVYYLFFVCGTLKCATDRETESWRHWLVHVSEKISDHQMYHYKCPIISESLWHSLSS